MRAVCPGSFDPITNGHIDIINRAVAMFDEVEVLVVINPMKKPMFSPQERVNMIEECFLGCEKVKVDSYCGLLTDYMREHQINIIVKGLRAMSDFEYEFQMSLTNKKLYPKAETVFLTTTTENLYLSSSLVKQVACFGGNFNDFVPECIVTHLKNKWEEINK